MSLQTRRAAAVAKLQSLKVSGNRKETDWDIEFLRREIAAIDQKMLFDEMERLANSKHLSFQGETLEQKLGVDSWLLPQERKRA